MWWSRNTARILCAAAAFAAELALASCGFHPLYGRANPEVVPEMATVRIRPFTGPRTPDNITEQDTARIGQELRNTLFTMLNLKGEPSNPKYELNAKLTESKQSLAVQKTEVATRANLTIDAQYSLREIATGHTVVSATSRGIASYDIVQSEYTNLTASRDAEKRALQSIADDMTLHISFYFTQKRKEPEPAQGPPPLAPGQAPSTAPAYRGYPVGPEPVLPAPPAPPGAYPAPGYPPPQSAWPTGAPPLQEDTMPAYPGYPDYQPAPPQLPRYEPPYKRQTYPPPQ